MNKPGLLFICVVFLLSTSLFGRTHHPPDVKYIEVEGVSIPVPPFEHPRLFLRARDIDDLKKRLSHPVLKPVWEDLQKEAAKNTQNRVTVDALRYLIDPDPELGRRTLAAALDTIRKSSWIDPHLRDQSRPIGRMMVTGAAVYDWCYELLTGDQKDTFIEQLIRLAKMLECGYPPTSRGSVTGHSSEWMIMRDMISAGIAIYDEYPEMYHLAAARYFGEHLPVRNWWYPGHAFHQGSAYAETRFSSDLYPLWIFDRLGAGNVYHPAQQFVPYQWIYIKRPDGQLLRSGDGQSKPPKLRSLLCASYYGDGYVLADYLENPGIYGMNKLYEFLWRDPDLQPLPKTDLPLSRYMGFPYGWMVARSGWDQQSVICEMKVNIYNFINHQHHDAGAFQIYYNGPLAIDSGLYQGTGGSYISAHNVNYYKRTIAHNSLLIYDPEEKFLTGGFRNIKKVNDGGQRLPHLWREAASLDQLLNADFKTGEVSGHWFGPNPKLPEYTYLKGDITASYSAKVRQVERSFVFMNLNERAVPAVLAVFDRIVSSSASFKKYWLLHSMEEPEIKGNRVTVTLSRPGWSGKLVNTNLLPGPGDIETSKVGGPGREFWVFGENFPNQVLPGRNPDDYETGEWRVELSPIKRRATSLFLNVMEVMKAGTASPYSVEKIESADLVGVKIAGRVVLFNKGGIRADRPLFFSIKGHGLYKLLVTDLAEGTWQVWKNGRLFIPALEVTADAGILYFQGEAGSYELRR